MFLTLIAVLASAWPAAAAASQPPCQRRCGDVDIPYPFGIGRGCYLYTGENDVTFGLTCNLTAAGTYRPFSFDVEVLGVSVARGEARVRNEINPWCYNGTSRSMDQRSLMWTDFSGSSFMLSDEDNRFTVVGCNSLAYVSSLDTSQFSTGSTYMTGCMATCPGAAARQLENGSCSGMGCCQAAIPRGINSYVVAFEEKFNTTAVVNFSRCSYAVLVEATWFDFRTTYVTAGNFMASTGGKVPLVLDWVVGKVTCREAMRNTTTAYACISSNSVCVDSRNGPGYLCNCSRGYQGNPYLQGGCRDIDECGDGGISYPCSVPGTCINTHGGFRCACPRGYRGNPRIKDGCIKSSLGLGLSVGIGIGSGAGLLLLVFGAIFVTRKIKHRRARALKHQFFRQNRGHLLQQLVSQKADIAERMIIPLAELEKATNNFDKAREIGGGGHGLVYKGIMSDQHVVAIKKSKVTVRREIDEFINEVAILSQINHLNVVKLFGCCLETEVPLLVYEFISNGTLYHHLHVEEPNRSLPWVDRVRIATETARALAYLHLAVSVPIVHRDIKSQNILLDGTLVAKVSDFGASRCIPVDQTGDETAIQGTFGYLDPLYFYSGQLSEQSDVYSFGVLLMELLTRKKPCSYRSSEDKSLVACFTALLEQGDLANLLDPQVVMEGGKKVDDVAILAAACVRMEGAQRPTMRQVEMALENLRVPHQSIVIDDKKDEPSYAVIQGTVREEVSRQYSLEEEYLLSSRYPR